MHILFRDGANVKLVQWEDKQAANIKDIITLAGPQKIYYSDTSGAIWMENPEASLVSAYELVPEDERKMILLPELSEKPNERGNL